MPPPRPQQAAVAALPALERVAVRRHDQARRVGRALVVAAGKGLVAQRELQAVVGGLQARLLQGALELGGVAAQQVERLGALDHQARRDMAAAVDVEPHVDAAELRRVETDLEAVASGLRARRDLDREALDRHRRGGGGTGGGGGRGGRRRGGAQVAIERLRQAAEVGQVDRRPAGWGRLRGFRLGGPRRRRGGLGRLRRALARARDARTGLVAAALRASRFAAAILARRRLDVGGGLRAGLGCGQLGRGFRGGGRAGRLRPVAGRRGGGRLGCRLFVGRRGALRRLVGNAGNDGGIAGARG